MIPRQIFKEQQEWQLVSDYHQDELTQEIDPQTHPRGCLQRNIDIRELRVHLGGGHG